MSSLRKEQHLSDNAHTEANKTLGLRIFNPWFCFASARGVGNKDDLSWGRFFLNSFKKGFSIPGLDIENSSFYGVNVGEFLNAEVSAVHFETTIYTFLRSIFYMPGLERIKVTCADGQKYDVAVNYKGVWFEWFIFGLAVAFFPITLMLALLRIVTYGLGCLRVIYTKFVLDTLWTQLTKGAFWLNTFGLGALLIAVAYFLLLIPLYEGLALAKEVFSWITSPINTFDKNWNSSSIAGKAYAIIGAIFAMGAIGAMCVFAPYVIGLILGYFGVSGAFAFLSSLITAIMPEFVALFGGIFGQFSAMLALTCSWGVIFFTACVAAYGIEQLASYDRVKLAAQKTKPGDAEAHIPSGERGKMNPEGIGFIENHYSGPPTPQGLGGTTSATQYVTGAPGNSGSVASWSSQSQSSMPAATTAMGAGQSQTILNAEEQALEDQKTNSSFNSRVSRVSSEESIGGDDALDVLRDEDHNLFDTQPGRLPRVNEETDGAADSSPSHSNT